jgi:hypothetical protein
MKMNINGHEEAVKAREVLSFKIANDTGSIGKIYKVDRPYILWIKCDPWNSEMHQFNTHEEAVKMLGEISKETDFFTNLTGSK